MAQHPVSSEHEEDGVLRDVLDELDRERSQRAELEAKVRLLLQNQEEKKESPSSRKQKGDVSKKDWIALQTEKDGLVELLDAILGDKPAFLAASKLSSLPLHAVRLLEIMPWDPRARQHAIGMEELYEWQFFHKNVWVQNIRQFPFFFRHLPIVQPKPGQEEHVRKKGIFGDLTAPPKHVVLTDAKLTHVVNIDKGCPLPDDDVTWEWVAGWRVDRHVAVTENKRTMDCDDQGWSYAREPKDFHTRELCWDSATGENRDVIRPYKRRKWTRPRVLVSYPYASQRTLEYLRLLGENMRLGVSVTKLSDQLVETKTALTETEERFLVTKEESRAELENMRTKLKDTEALFDDLELGLKHQEGRNDDSFKTKFLHVDNLRKEQAEKIQKLFRASSWNGSKTDDDTMGVHDDGDHGFDWKRIGRGTGSLLENIKNSPGLLARRKTSHDDGIRSTQLSGAKERQAQDQPLLLQPVDRDNGEKVSLNEKDQDIGTF
jgi:hypothetical protein